MTSPRLTIWVSAACLALLLSSPVLAAKPFCGDGKCNGGENAETCPADCSGGGGGNDPVAVCVDFREAVGDLVGGDVPADYCDGLDGVSATIGAQQGVFKLDTTAKSSQREVVVNFPGCDEFPGIDAGSGDCLTPALLVSRNGYTSGGDPTGEKVNLLGMAVGTSELVDFQINFPSTLSKSTPNVIVFGGQSADPCGFPVTVSHPDADSWTVTTPGGTELEACLWQVIKKNGNREYLVPPFDLPFEITITRIVP